MGLSSLLSKLHLKHNKNKSNNQGKQNNYYNNDINNINNVSLRRNNSYSENLNQLNSKHSIRKSQSFNDFKHNIVSSIKRSTSIRKNSYLKKSSLSNSNVNLTLDNHSNSFYKNKKNNYITNNNNNILKTLPEKQIENNFKTDLSQSNLSNSPNNFNNSTDETYTTLFNSLFNNYIDNDSDSIQSSYISNYDSNLINDNNKNLFLSNSKLPNYDISCSNSPFENPFSDFENYNDLPHEKLLLKASQIHGLSPTDSLSIAIKKHRKSLYLNSNENNNDDNDIDNIFDDKHNILPLPLNHNKPISSLPLLPNAYSPNFINPYKIINENNRNDKFLIDDVNNELNFNDFNSNDFDLEEKSLFDALSNVEWWDCSKITLATYNN